MFLSCSNVSTGNKKKYYPEITVAHNCHGKKKKITAMLLKSRQHKQSHGKIKDTHGKIKKTTVKIKKTHSSIKKETEK